MKRLDFVKQSSVLIAGMAFAKPFNIINRINNDGPVIGHGDFKYRVNYNWGNLGTSHPVKDCHEMVMDREKGFSCLPTRSRTTSSSTTDLANSWTAGAISFPEGMV